MEDDDMSKDTIDAKDFVEKASAKGIAEIETARMALEEGGPSVVAFARMMIADHTEANDELKAIARRANLEIADDATLMDQAKAMILSVRSGESFDEAYIKNQINAHEQTTNLFERASHSEIPEISAFARQKLPKLHEHLHMANELKARQDASSAH
ncbi:hypothetical protein PHACT_12365 [Pseudohongiella acticola]|uniref:DUF4142 domain-containing protein n=2 Tax=Pseudohongiella acticola TaxID=1524254 RepID=A0A1E8CG58_9GAMM|nr:hypothetical protein PHACT_12365 [Pseudohongiella acticola]